MTTWIVNCIANGYSLKDIVRRGGPAMPTLKRWRRESPEFRSLLIEAAADRTENYLEECIEIADNCNPEHAAKARLQIETRRFAMMNLLPHMYGRHIPGQGSGEDTASAGLIAPIVQIFFGKGKDETSPEPRPMRDVTPQSQLEARDDLMAAMKAEATGHGPPVIVPEFGRETETVLENVSDRVDKSSQEDHSQENVQAEDGDVFVGGR